MVEYKDGKKILTPPISEEELRDIRVGDVLYLSGEMITGRDAVHHRVVAEGRALPVDLHGGAILHAGPIVRPLDDGRYEMVSVGPTTSMRMEKFEYDFIKTTGVRLIIGKGGMRERSAQACRDFGCIHCVTPAGCAVLAAACVEEIEGVDWADLGMPEAVWRCRVKEFGPLFVSIDTRGGNYFEEQKKLYNQRREEQTERICKALHEK